MNEHQTDFDLWDFEYHHRDDDPEPAVPTPVAPAVDWRPVLYVWSAVAAGVIVLGVCVGLFWFGGAM